MLFNLWKFCKLVYWFYYYILGIEMRFLFIISLFFQGLSVQGAQAQWQSCNNGMNGFFKFNANNIVIAGGVVYVTDYDNAIMSTDTGKTWQSLNPASSYNSSIVLTADEKNIYEATYYDGLFKSTDKGESWNNIFNTKSPVSSIAVDGNFIILGTQNGVFISTDGGIEWQGSNMGLPTTSLYTMVIKGNNIFTSTYTHLFRSTDKGFTWDTVSFGIKNINSRCLAINGTDLLVGTEGGVLISNDNGNNWSKTDTVLNRRDVISIAASGKNVFAELIRDYLFRLTAEELGNRTLRLTPMKFIRLQF